MARFHHFTCDDCGIGITFKPVGDMNPYIQLELVTRKGWKIDMKGTLENTWREPKTYCEKCSTKE